MHWLADECISARVVDSLRTAGHDVVSAAEAFSSATDRDLLEYAMRENRLLLAEDKDVVEETRFRVRFLEP